MTNPTEPTTSKLDQLAERLRKAADVCEFRSGFHATPLANGDILRQAARALQAADASLARMTEERDEALNDARAYADTAKMQREWKEEAEASLSQLQADAGGERLRAAKAHLVDARRRLVAAGDNYGARLITDALASLALSGGTEKQGLSSSNASRAAMGPVAHLAPEAEPSAAENLSILERARLRATWAVHDLIDASDVDLNMWDACSEEGVPDQAEQRHSRFKAALDLLELEAPKPANPVSPQEGASAETEGL